MRRPTRKRDHPLSMRLSEADIAIINRAAGLRGRSRTDFARDAAARDAAVRAAEEVLMETTIVRMTPGGFAAFVKALSGSATPVPWWSCSIVGRRGKPANRESDGSVPSALPRSIRTGQPPDPVPPAAWAARDGPDVDRERDRNRPAQARARPLCDRRPPNWSGGAIGLRSADTMTRPVPRYVSAGGDRSFPWVMLSRPTACRV